jgi:outer membrane receptor protein involved in Fe transport
LDTYEVQPQPGSAIYDCAGLFGTTCGNPAPDWRHNLRITWGTPWSLDLSLAWRHVGSVSFDGNEADPSLTNGFFDEADAGIPAEDYFDLAFDWDVTDNIKMTGGINNFLDSTPKTLDSNVLGISSPPFGNANTYPVIYDSLGREVFIGMSTRF